LLFFESIIEGMNWKRLRSVHEYQDGERKILFWFKLSSFF